MAAAFIAHSGMARRWQIADPSDGPPIARRLRLDSERK